MIKTFLQCALARRSRLARGTRLEATRLAGASFAQQEPSLAQDFGLPATGLSDSAVAGPGLFG